jgi:hypothetical protein
MKCLLKLSVLPLLALLLGGCSNLTAKLPNGTMVKATSVACKRSIGTLIISTNGTATLSNYNLDQVAGTQAVAEGVAKGVVAGMKP